MKKLSIILYTLSAIVSACNNSENTSGNNQHEEDEHLETSTVSITPEQADMIELELGAPKQTNMGGSIKVIGRLELFPQDQAKISPFIGGNVKAIYVIEGDHVKKGQVLARLEHPTYIQLQQELLQQNSQLEYLKLEFERKERLYQEQVTSGKEFQKAKAAYFSTSSAVSGLVSKLKLLGLDTSSILQGEISSTIPITSPISGYVKRVAISMGDYIEPKFDMIEITDNSRIHVDLRVFEKDIFKVKEGQKIYFTVANHPGRSLEATIHSLGQSFEDDPKSIHVHGHIENKNGELLPGMYVEGRIVVEERQTLAIPSDAVVTEGDQAYIFVKTNTEDHPSEDHPNDGQERLTFKRVPITVGVREGGLVGISAPDADTGQIVFKGAYLLSSEMVKGSLDHPH